MSDIKKNIIYTAADIEQYLAGKLSAMQMHAMEKAALDDAFLAEAMEGYEAMQHKEWNNELVALRVEIAGKGTVAKVIPLHPSKNNWRKIAAAIFIVGAATTLTFILTKNNPEKKSKPEIAQTIITTKDTLLQLNNDAPVSVTASLNPTASSPKEELKAKNGSVTHTTITPQNDDRYIADPAAPQFKSATQNAGAITPANDKVIAAAPPANSNVSTADNTRLAEESYDAKSRAASKANYDAEVLNRQRNQVFSKEKKEAVLNNFFTAQVMSSDNTPLPFTNISIKKDNFGTYADAKGIVRLVSTDSILNVEVKSVGYLPKTFILRNNQVPTKIILQEDEVALKDRTVIGNTNTAAANQKSRRATLLTDSAVNVEPADGWDNYNTYVANNLDIPDDILKRDFHGEVEISFDVKSNGTISNIRVNKSLGAGYDEAAKRLIMDGPQWKVKKGRKTSASIKVQF